MKNQKLIEVKIPLNKCDDSWYGNLVKNGLEGESEIEEYDAGVSTGLVFKAFYFNSKSKVFVKAFFSKFKFAQITELKNEDWATKWKEDYKGLNIGDVFAIRPPDLAKLNIGSRIPIIINPAMAFGTGKHATTFACMSYLSKLSGELTESLKASLKLLDYGTGSGIIAIGAKKLGFQDVLGIDNDAECVSECKKNAKLNKVNCKFELGESPKYKNAADKFDIIFANIQSGVLISQKFNMINALNSGGKLFMSGILLSELHNLVNEFVGFGNVKAYRADISDNCEWAAVLVEIE